MKVIVYSRGSTRNTMVLQVPDGALCVSALTGGM